MRTINKSRARFFIGRKVIVKKEYQSGSTYLYIGEAGEVIGLSKISLPDFGLIDVTVLDIKFGGETVSWGEGLVEEYLDLLG